MVYCTLWRNIRLSRLAYALSQQAKQRRWRGLFSQSLWGHTPQSLKTSPKSPLPKASLTPQEHHLEDQTFNIWGFGGTLTIQILVSSFFLDMAWYWLALISAVPQALLPSHFFYWNPSFRRYQGGEVCGSHVFQPELHQNLKWFSILSVFGKQFVQKCRGRNSGVRQLPKPE